MIYTFIARALLGPAGRGVLSGDEGVDLGLLRVAGPAGAATATATTPC